jgi:hypothetical protein
MCDICCVGTICGGIIRDFSVIFYVCTLSKVHFTAIIMPNFFHKQEYFGIIFLANLAGFFCKIMSTGSPQRRVCQRTKGDRAALRAKIMDRPVIAEWNVV